MKELVFEELTLEQKLGLVLIGGGSWPLQRDPEEMAFQLDLIRKRALGAIWISPNDSDPLWQDTIRLIRETADYPILIFTDAGSGFGQPKIGDQISLGYADDEDLAYTFGKVTAVKAHNAGYNVVCNPLLDRVDHNVPCGGTVRTLSPDKEKSARLAAAMARGMHDGGILTVGKHYPSVADDIDSHMAESCAMEDKETLLKDNLYAYQYLDKRGLLDGVMTSHTLLPKIDDKYPATLSKKVMDVFRETGFDGLMLTDAMSMMGVVAKFGAGHSKAQALAGGNDFILVFSSMIKAYEAMKEGYADGTITEERLNEAVKRVLKAQHKAMQAPKYTELTEEDEKKFNRINEKSVATIVDPGLTASIDPNGHYLFMLLTDQKVDLEAPRVNEDTLTFRWYDPFRIAQEIKKRFPNSDTATLAEYPVNWDIAAACEKELAYDDVVFITFCNYYPYAGKEQFTSRIVSVFEAWQVTHRICALLHFGNPFVMEDLPHVPRILNGCRSAGCVITALDILAGTREAEGKIPYKIKLK